MHTILAATLALAVAPDIGERTAIASPDIATETLTYATAPAAAAADGERPLRLDLYWPGDDGSESRRPGNCPPRAGPESEGSRPADGELEWMEHRDSDATPGSPRDLLDRLVGSWTLTGTMGAIELRQRVTARWVVGEQFLQMHFVQEGPSDPGKPPYEALYLLGYDERSDQLVLHLFDTFGTSFSRTLGIGTRRGDAVELLFDYPSGLFSNTFAWDAKTDRWTMTLRQREADGGWRLFAVKTPTRP